jgi:hypothetical protein
VLGFVATAALRRDDPFQTTARGLSLNLTRTVPDLLPRIEGMINGLPVRIEISERTDPGVRYTVFYPPLGMALKLQRETNITRTLGELGESDPQVGARAFDDSFRVNTSRPDALRDMMNPELRRALVRLIEKYPKLVIADGDITLATDDWTPSAEVMVATITEMASAAHQLVNRRPPPLARPTVAEPAKTQPAAPPPARKPEPEPTPTPPKTPAPRKVEPPEPVSAAPPTPPPATATGLPDGFFDDVFGANRLSFESSGDFDQRLRGKQVRLSGTVKQARTETEGGEPVTKATVTVAQIDNDLYGKTDVDAVIYLTSTATNLERGQTVTFTGELDGVDAFMRNLFVRNARLVN